MKKRLLTILVLASLTLTTQQVSAHVLTTDETNSKGAILHIIPDDDPIAGQKATLFFDTQDQLLKNATNSEVTLTIKDTNNNQVTVPTKIEGSLVTADFIFPVQGTYELTYTATAGNSAYTFSQTQRVSRGTVSSALDKPTYPWAEMLLIGSGVGIILLAVIALNHRGGIAKQSRL